MPIVGKLQGKGSNHVGLKNSNKYDEFLDFMLDPEQDILIPEEWKQVK